MSDAMNPQSHDRFVAGPKGRLRRLGTAGRSFPSGRLLARTALAVLLVGGVGALPSAATGASPGSRRSTGSTHPTHVQRGGAHRPLAGATQVTAHNGQFWTGSIPIVFHGIMHSPGQSQGVKNDLDTIASWGMNTVRFTFTWCQLEPDANGPPVRNGNTWTHNWDSGYVSTLKQDIAWAQADGISPVIALYGGDCSYFSYPDYLYQAQYNSKGITYKETPAGRDQANGDFWSDSLRQQFLNDMWTYLAGQLASTPGILGYEVLNEPPRGTLPATQGTVQTCLDVQLSIAKAIRAADPARVVFFTTFAGYGPGTPDADFSGWQSLGNVAFDMHEYFGARWGDSLVENPDSDGYHVGMEPVYAMTVDGTSPYIGTTDSQVRYLRMEMDALKKWGIPMMIGEVGDNDQDIGATNFFGTAMSALNYVGVSWASDWGSNYGITDAGGGFRAYAPIVIDAAGQYP